MDTTEQHPAVQHYGSLQALADVIGRTRQALHYRLSEQRHLLTGEEALKVHTDSGLPLNKLRPDLWD